MCTKRTEMLKKAKDFLNTLDINTKEQEILEWLIQEVEQLPQKLISPFNSSHKREDNLMFNIYGGFIRVEKPGQRRTSLTINLENINFKEKI